MLLGLLLRVPTSSWLAAAAASAAPSRAERCLRRPCRALPLPGAPTMAEVVCSWFPTNSLTSVPTELGKLQSLIGLKVDHNLFTKVPTELAQLTLNLQGLYLHANLLTAVPTQLGYMSSLLGLTLHLNSLAAAPTELGRLLNLQSLHSITIWRIRNNGE